MRGRLRKSALGPDRDPDGVPCAASAAAGADCVLGDVVAAAGEPLGEGPVGRGGPDREHAARFQRRARPVQAGLAVERVVVRAGEAVGAVVDVEQDGVERARRPVDRGADIAGLNRDARVGETVGEDRLHVARRPVDEIRDDLRDRQARVGRRARLRRAQGEAHAKPADQHMRRGAACEAVESQRGERFFRPAEAAVHQLVAAFEAD